MKSWCSVLLFALLLLYRGANIATAEYTFAMIPKDINNPFFLPAKDGCADNAKILGARCLYVGPTTESQEEQAKIMRELVADGSIDGITVSCISKEYLTPVINEVVKAGIPVVTFDSDSPESLRAAYIGTNNRFFGESLAKVMNQLLPTGGTYALVATSAPNILERVDGFHSLVETEGDWIELEDSPSDFQGNLTIAMENMQMFAARNPTAIIPLMGAPMRSGSWGKFVEEHRHRNITLISGDATTNQLDFLRRGYVSGLVGQLPYEMGQMSVNVLFNLVQGRNPEEEILGTNVLTHLLVPLVLPELTVDHNLIGELRYVGWILFGLVGMLSAACALWTFRNRNIHIVKVSQPLFLIMVAVGMFVLASSMVPLSLDDGANPDCNSKSRCTLICMSIPWLGCLGFTISFSALFSKTMRINRLFHSDHSFLRVKVTEKDVMIPFLGLLSANVIVLLCWTLIDPLVYVRDAHRGLDEWSRVISTYGGCRSESVLPFLVPLLVINVSVLALANWQAYEARRLESELSEAKYIGFTMISTLQAATLAIPVLFAVKRHPVPFYLILTFAIFIVCTATLLFIFVPKIVFAESFMRRTASEQRSLIRASIRRSQMVSSHGRRSPAGRSSDSLRPGVSGELCFMCQCNFVDAASGLSSPMRLVLDERISAIDETPTSGSQPCANNEDPSHADTSSVQQVESSPDRTTDGNEDESAVISAKSVENGLSSNNNNSSSGTSQSVTARISVSSLPRCESCSRSSGVAGGESSVTHSAHVTVTSSQADAVPTTTQNFTIQEISAATDDDRLFGSPQIETTATQPCFEEERKSESSTPE